METVNKIAAVVLPFWTVFGPGLVLWLGWMAVAEMQRRGYSTTYVSALMRGVGAGVAAAQAKGLDPFSVAGRAVVATGGADYMAAQVGGVAKSLGIDYIQHGEKVLAQMDAIKVQADADAKATAGQFDTSMASLAAKMALNPSLIIPAGVMTEEVADAMKPGGVLHPGTSS